MIPVPRGRPKGLPKIGGRKKGQPNKATKEIKAIAGQHGEEVIGILLGIARASESDPARVAACREIIDRGYGKAAQPLTNDQDTGPFVVKVLKFGGDNAS